MTKKAIVIGASSGIGKALAVKLSEEGYEVGLASRRLELLEKVQYKLSTKSYIKQLDLKQFFSATQKLEELIEKMGDVDLIIINSGVGIRNLELNLHSELETINVNVSGFAAMANVAVKYFLKRQSGHLVGISSIAGLRGAAYSPAYNASKAFMSNYMEGLRQKLFKTGIYVTDIRPGFVETDMIKENKVKFWVASPEKAAKQIIDAINKKKKIAYITKRWIIFAFISKILPECFYHHLYLKARAKS